MTVRNGKGWITIKRGRIVTSGETALESKALAHIQKQSQQESKRHDRTKQAR